MTIRMKNTAAGRSKRLHLETSTGLGELIGNAMARAFETPNSSFSNTASGLSQTPSSTEGQIFKHLILQGKILIQTTKLVDP